MDVKGLARSGDFAGALRALGMKAPPDFVLKSRDPRQDMQYGESLLLCDAPAPYRRALRFLSRKRIEAPLLAGVLETILGRFAPAIARLTLAVDDGAGSFALAWRGVARALEERRRRRSDGLPEALKDLDLAIALGPARGFAYYWRAELRHDLEDPSGALEDLAEILKKNPGDAWARVERGEILCETGRAEEALAEFDRLVAALPKAAWARALRGRTLATTGREKESLPDLLKAITLAPRSGAARAWLSESYRKLGRHRDALAELDRAVKLEPSFALAWVWRGRLRLLQGKPALALKDLDRAVKLDARYKLALAWRGEALHKLGRKAEAARDFARVAPLDPARTWNPVLAEGELLTPEARARAYSARDANLDLPRGKSRSAKPDRCDLLVIGGGPAGATLATLVKKHAPEKRVILAERESGPRHHIGESLLPGLVPVLKEMGVFEKIDAAGFPRKIGANYVWGKGREVWENDFNDVNLTEMLRRHGTIPEKIEYAWQVRRSVYDEILLKHAEECGVEVRRGWAARAPVEEGGRITGVRFEQGEVRAERTADCSGQAGFLSRFRKIRDYNDALKNVAAYRYYKGAPWKYSYSGHPDKTKIFVCSVPSGWFWYIPIDGGVVSVGFVTSQAHLKKTRLSPEALFDRELAACEEIAPLLGKAEPIDDFDGSGKSFFTISDWSYLNVAASGPGWLAAGDAAVFVDPILSSGVTLAHTAAHRAAYTLLTHWDGGDAAALWKDYDLFCRESASQFLALALFWYGNDRSAQRWWERARDLQRAWLPFDIGDQTAFIAVSAGLTRYYERSLSAAGLAAGEAAKPEDFPFLVSVLGLDEARPRAERVKLSCPYEVEVVYVPDAARARLRPVKRARFLKHDVQDPLSDAVNPRLIVTRYHLALLALLDGRTWKRARAAALEKDVPAW